MLSQEQLIKIYQGVIEPKIKNWVVFANGTCVILYHPKGNLEMQAKEVLQKYGKVYPGTSSADFTVLKVDPGWIVAGDQPGILNYVSEDEGRDMEDFEIGLVGRNKKELDIKELKIIYVQN